MAFSKDQREPSMPIDGNAKRSSVDFLPRYFRTGTNQKFLNATVDQLISVGEIDKINAYIGRRNSKVRLTDDKYLEDVSVEREAYQLEPSLIIQDSLDNITFFKDYNDYINQLKFFNSDVSNQSLVNSQEFYSWNPHIDWDKFVNYREYYWLPNGPQVVSIVGQSNAITSTYNVTLVNDGDNIAYLFTPDGLTRNPRIKLYRGQTYYFNIDCPGYPMAFKTVRDTTDSYILNDTNGVESDTVWVEKGVIKFTIPQTASNLVYYVSRTDVNTSGFFNIFDIEENTAIDVEKEIIGKQTYVTASGFSLSNGMKINFLGNVTPEKYATGNWYVDGVGDKIQLVAEKDLEVPAIFTNNENIEFDNEQFDTQGFDVNSNYPATKDYITINRASKDRNAWSRYNRWFHKDVIEQSALLNLQTVDLNQESRAKRPIIEFNAGLQLINHGRQAKANVDLVDTTTTDVFSIIEGSLGYNVDGVDLVPGMRVLFTADTDIRVNGRIFKVGKLTHLGITRLTLLEETDTEPVEGETVLVLNGSNYRGSMFYYTGDYWKLAQAKTSINQTPLFDVFDENGISFADSSVYVGSTFKGTKLFSYRIGTNYDSELGFNIAYKNIGNIGDIVFDFNLHTDTLSYQELALVNTIKTDIGYLKLNNGLSSTETVNGWVTAAFDSKQPVVKIYNVEFPESFFAIDVYDNSGDLTDLTADVWVNGSKQTGLDFEIYRQDDTAYIRFFNNLNSGDIVIIETESSASKNSNGFYKFPLNLESNPQNLSLTDFTLGEIINHVQSISENNSEFTGALPGVSNLRDLGKVSKFGTKIVQHSSPIVQSAYHITDKEFNVIKSLRYAKDEYSKFKRNLIREATDYGYDGNIATHLDLVLAKVTKEKLKTSPFYLSDMVPFGAKFVYDQTVIDNSITEYPLTFDFDLLVPSEKSVLVYLNDELLLHKRDYEFVNASFVNILVPLTSGDRLQIAQYNSTDGCCVPPTPSKLGIYPVYEPKIFVDTSYQTPTRVIQGHDGSITVAFNDYRDDLLLEFEKRIYNNIKVSYNTSLFDIYSFIEGANRTTDLSQESLNSVLRQEFLKWSRFISEDYTKHTFYQTSNAFTYNYRKFVDQDSNPLNGYWRGIFKYFYDTDRPHICPWEMLGLTEEPAWWSSVYGPAPYTKDNLVMWQDLSEGLIKEPNKLPIRNSKFVRPNLLNQIPVDAEGNLADPISIGLVKNYTLTKTKGEFTFGDQAPIETAWRRSSEFPFALITALTVLRPSKVFASCFDRVRQIRDGAGQIVYKTDAGNLRFNCADVVFPATSASDNRVFTSGLVNYIVNYAIRSSMDSVDTYEQNIAGLKVKIASKLGGFVSKDKFKLILDSRTPTNQSNVFIPEENYSIILNTSSPVLSISYSGVIIEKQSSGFVVKGYNLATPEFRYFKPLVTASDPVINIGGISESFVDWDSEKYYNKGSIVRYEQSYYRTTAAHSSGVSFESKYFAKLPSLPIVGGRDIILRRNFSTIENVLHYGAELLTVQDVVDFLLGYGEYLKSVGFEFEFYNDNLKTVVDWQTSAKEFVFWTTQNWAVGSVISLSASADELKFQKPYSVVDNIYDNFYEYSIFKENGTVLDPLFTNSLREENNFTLVPKNTADGIYHATLNLVQKEHVLVLDNVTVFNDIIYDQIQGYRQERIKVLGYRTASWNGDFNIPGFVYDRAVVTDWSPWRDYALGETVKYKEFYYSAKNNIPGTETFDYNNWYKLNKRPEAQLIPNWDYRANQFFDFYDLDSDSFDITQQKFAQHLIGYQRRDYLENIINDDVAQYKFYQGMIQEKGTQNSLIKLFDALNTADKDSLEFYEEWAIRLGQYGASAGFEEVEFKLDETQFLINPQPIELVNAIEPNLNDFVYRIIPSEVYLAPETYTHTPFPVNKDQTEYVKTAGYVHAEDVKAIFKTKDDFATLDISTLSNGDYFWVGFDNSSYIDDSNNRQVNFWNVYRFGIFATRIQRLEIFGTELVIKLSNSKDSDINVGDYIGIANTVTELVGIYKVTAVDAREITISLPNNIDQNIVDTINSEPAVNLYKFSSQRIATIDDLNKLSLYLKKENELVWVDGGSEGWKVWKFSNNYKTDVVSSPTVEFSKSFTVNDNSNIMAISSSGKVMYYYRPDTNFEWANIDSIQEDSVPYNNPNGTFGDFILLDTLGENLYISAPGSDFNKGYVVEFNKNNDNYFVISNKKFPSVSDSSFLNEDEFFGYKTAIIGDYLIVASQGNSSSVAGAITVFDRTSANRTDRQEFAGVTVTDISASSEGTLVVATSDAIVRVYTLDTGILGTAEILSNVEFGNSIAITRDGTTIAVGESFYSGVNPAQGAVKIYNKGISGYEFYETVLSPLNQEGERFGYGVKFNISGDQLVVYSLFGDQTIPTLFDAANTTFDLNATNFVETQPMTGAVKVFDKYSNKFVYSAELEPSTPLNGMYYGSDLVVTDRIYVNDPSMTSGAVYEFYSKDKVWTVYRQLAERVIVDNIKSVFIYDTRENNILANIDFIDPIKGKILGIAEQELSYKTPYDPATYSIGDDQVVVDSLMFWKEKQLGKLWWDLSSIKFVDPYQGSAVYKANTWNTAFPGSSVDVYEWVESEYLPSEWDAIADTEEGLTLGISGTSKYGDAVYSYKQKYDTISKTFKNVYYYWVKNKTVVPDVEFRKISASDVANYIEDPKSKGVPYVALLGANQFALINCRELIYNKDTAINFRYWIIKNKEINIHNHYQLLSVGEVTEKLNPYVEQKWFDSLIGYDAQGNDVPDFRLPAKLKYGILSTPRQSMFINRIEALKQFVERVNSVLITKSIVDDYNFDSLNSKDEPESITSGKYDVVIDTYSEIRFLGVANFINAELIPVVEDGKIKRVVIENAGRGYGKLSPETYDSEGNPTTWLGPNVTISGTGRDAKIKTVVNARGEIISAEVIKEGREYIEEYDLTDPTILLTPKLTVRTFTVLVSNDETASGKWAVYTLNPTTLTWSRAKTQTYDTTKYWYRTDWYASGYNQFTKVNYDIDFAYQLPLINIQIGEIVKINNEGSAGWVLLEKINDQDTLETTVNYKIVGRQNGTIQLGSNLYQYVKNNVGYDGPTFDNDLFDDQPNEELRIILNSIKNELFVSDLEVEYNKLFFASLRYIFSEQPFVDWAFKTSFVKAKHNLGELEQTPTYQSNTLPNYESYIEEVKPYRTKVREFISNFTNVENTQTFVTDFDLPARYNPLTNKIETFQVSVRDDNIVYNSSDILEAPYSSWYRNAGHSIISIEVTDGGSGYKSAPVVEIVGGSDTPAVAKAYLTNGSVNKIIVEYSGSGYLVTPTIVLNGSFETGGSQARAVAILGNSLVRSTKIGIKFDRISPTYQVTDLTVTETFTGSGSQSLFRLKWPVDIQTNKVSVIVNNEEKLLSEFEVYNALDTTASYTKHYGMLRFTSLDVVPNNAEIVINYVKNIDLLDAADRIQHYYNPLPGQLGKDLGQLMQGVDYGGVEITGVDFDLGSGWDALPWFTSGWDSYDPNYTDFLVRASLTSTVYTLPYVPAVGELINVYWLGTRDNLPFNIRIDTPDTGLMETFVGDGVTDQITLPVISDLQADDQFIFRKSTSDGSFVPTTTTFDTDLSGGDLAYTIAKGIDAAEITVDGDGLITPFTSHAPEEVVPGHVADSVDIKVFHKFSDGTPVILTKIHIVSDVETLDYSIGQYPALNSSVFVKINGQIKHEDVDYVINYPQQTITLLSTPSLQDEIVITSPSSSGTNILDIDNFVADGVIQEFVTKARPLNGYTAFVTVNGEPTSVVTFITDSSYDTLNNVGFIFATPPSAGSIINYIVVAGEVDIINLVNRETIVYVEGTQVYNLSTVQGNYEPYDAPMVVEVNGHVLRPSNFFYFDVSGNSRTYTISPISFAYNSVDSVDLSVYLNGNELVIGRDYSWSSATNELKIKRGVAVSGDRIIVEVYKNAEYTVHKNVNGLIQLDLINTYETGTEITVTAFIDNNVIRLERTNDYIKTETALVPGTVDYYRFNQISGGRFKINSPAISAAYIWVSLNNELLTPEIDYILEDNLQYVLLDTHIRLTVDDNVDLIVFSSKMAKTPFGYSIFKDMLNRVTYKRIDDLTGTTLAQPLNYYSSSMTLVDASNLPEPSVERNLPGVIVIDNERIEYFRKTGNVLSQLRRGTLGTGVKSVYPAGTLVRDQGSNQTIPYTDEVINAVSYSNGVTTQVIPLEYVPTVAANTTGNSWYRTSIPEGFGQCDEIEVFVAGRRLRKAPIIKQSEVDPSVNVEFEAEYSVDGTSKSVRLTTVPDAGTLIQVVKRIGRFWAPEGVSLADAETDPARFIRAKTATLPQ